MALSYNQTYRAISLIMDLNLSTILFFLLLSKLELQSQIGFAQNTDWLKSNTRTFRGKLECSWPSLQVFLVFGLINR